MMKKRSLIACSLIALMMGCAPREDDHDNHDHEPGQDHDHSRVIRTYRSEINMVSLIAEPLQAAETGPGQ